MRLSQDTQTLVIGGMLGLLAGAGGLGAPAAVQAATNSYVPTSGGNWHVAGNWSLGHCPLTNEDVEIIVSGSSHKAVNYNWTGSTDFATLTIDGSSAGFYGALWHLDHTLETYDMFVGGAGPAWHWMEGTAFLDVIDDLRVGDAGDGLGHLYLNVDSGSAHGVSVGDLLYVGYMAPGDFDHINGEVVTNHLYVGQNDPGTYWLKGSESTSNLTVNYYAIIGNGNEGLFEQTGGTFDQLGTAGTSVILGLNPDGEGTYLMRGGLLNAHRISVALEGDGYFTQSGGTVNITSDLRIGRDGAHPMRAWYKINEDDGPAVLDVGDDLKVGEHSLAKYEQYGGTVTVDGELGIWKGTTDPYASSYVYLGTSAGMLAAGSVTNHTGYYDQDGGIMTTGTFTNDSAQGINLDNNADFRAMTLNNSQGTVQMWRNARLRGPLAIPPSIFFVCDFTNDGTFQMGNASFNGGTFSGHLTNNGTFNYYQGDFGGSRLINHGLFYNYGDFECLQIVNHANIAVTAGHPVYADGGGYEYAIENYGNFTVHAGAEVHLTGDKPLWSDGAMYADGSIYGDVENYGYLLPAISSGTGWLYISGDYAQYPGAEMRIRIGGLIPANDYDRVSAGGSMSLGGELDVRLVGGFVPSPGDTFQVVTCNGRSGTFSPVYLPDLPDDDWGWRLIYTQTGLTLGIGVPGDYNGDGDIDLSDHRVFQDCMAGPEVAPDPVITTAAICLEVFDFDADSDVDLDDFSDFSEAFTGW